MVAMASMGCSQEPDERFEPKPIVDKGRVRFIALGDGGEGNDAQYANAQGIASVCAEQGCDFALYLGDNIYDSGVDSVDDEQFLNKFELPYEQLDFPFYVVMGNHDYGGNGVGNEPEKVDFEVGYTERSEKVDHARTLLLFRTGAHRLFWLRYQRDILVLGGSTTRMAGLQAAPEPHALEDCLWSSPLHFKWSSR